MIIFNSFLYLKRCKYYYIFEHLYIFVNKLTCEFPRCVIRHSGESTEARFLNSEELSRIKSSPLYLPTPQLPGPGKS